MQKKQSIELCLNEDDGGKNLLDDDRRELMRVARCYDNGEKNND
jgi:hypothetical protein